MNLSGSSHPIDLSDIQEPKGKASRCEYAFAQASFYSGAIVRVLPLDGRVQCRIQLQPSTVVRSFARMYERI